ncbi:hypothetical protein ACTXT7_013946 [Hymenolepis weldensis]
MNKNPILIESEFREYTRVDYNVSCTLPWVIGFCVKLLYYRVFKIVGSARLLPGLLVGYVITSGDTVMNSIETAKITAIVRCIMEQMHLSKPDKDPEDHIKNVSEFHFEPSVGEIFMTWYAGNRDIYENRMAGDHNLYLAYLLPLSLKDLTFEETIRKRACCIDIVVWVVLYCGVVGSCL